LLTAYVYVAVGAVGCEATIAGPLNPDQSQPALKVVKSETDHAATATVKS